MSLRLHIIVASTRPGRIGPKIAAWVHQFAGENSEFDAHLVDLADFDLPVYNEPNHPRAQNYEHEATRAWSESVGAADAYVIVMPEYNSGPPPALLNALNYVYKEWNYKPAAFVSYGGVSGGLRAVEMTKGTLNTLKVVPQAEGVILPMVFGQVDEDGFNPEQIHVDSARVMLGELHRWATTLKPMRATPVAAAA